MLPYKYLDGLMALHLDKVYIYREQLFFHIVSHFVEILGTSLHFPLFVCPLTRLSLE